MKFICIPVLLFLFACHSDNNNKIPPAPPTADSPRNAIILPPHIAGVHKYLGTIGKTIPVFMWFAVRDSVVKGQIIYMNTEKRKPITLVVIVSSANLNLVEFSDDGSISGTLSGQVVNNKFTGIWSSPSIRKGSPFDFTAKDTILDNIDIQLEPDNIAGQYFYSSDRDGQGAMEVHLITNNLVSFDISRVTAAPSFHIANVPTDTVTVTDNMIDYIMPEAPGCRFRIKFYKGFAIIDFINEQYDCNFGLNAYVDGIYLKLKP